MYAEFADSRKYIQDVLSKRNATMSALIASYDTYEDLLSKASKGLEFYNKLETNVTKLLQRVKGACKVQQEEREQILIKNRIEPKTTTASNTSTVSTTKTPKLKDYLESMKGKEIQAADGFNYAAETSVWKAANAESGPDSHQTSYIPQHYTTTRENPGKDNKNLEDEIVKRMQSLMSNNKSGNVAAQGQYNVNQNYNTYSYASPNQNTVPTNSYQPISSIQNPYPAGNMEQYSNYATNTSYPAVTSGLASTSSGYGTAIAANISNAPENSYVYGLGAEASVYNQATTYPQYSMYGTNQIPLDSSLTYAQDTTLTVSRAQSNPAYNPVQSYSTPNASYATPNQNYPQNVSYNTFPTQTSQATYQIPAATYSGYPGDVNQYPQTVQYPAESSTESYQNYSQYYNQTNYAGNAYNVQNNYPTTAYDYEATNSQNIPSNYKTYTTAATSIGTTTTYGSYPNSSTPQTNAFYGNYPNYSSATLPQSNFSEQSSTSTQPSYDTSNQPVYPAYYPSYNYQTVNQEQPQTPQIQPIQAEPKKKASNIDLLAGLDFSVNQTPLTPQSSTTNTTKEREPRQKIEPFRAFKAPVKNETTELKTDRVPRKDPFQNPDVVKQFGVELEKFERFVEELNCKTANGQSVLDLKWKGIQDVQDVDATKKVVSVARCYPMKNRFADILPYDFSRVELRTTRDDYVNASFVKDVTVNSPPFIITQAPLPATYADFWALVWEQQVENIVCLLGDNEVIFLTSSPCENMKSSAPICRR